MNRQLLRHGSQSGFALLLLILAYVMWVSPQTKAIAAGVAIFLFGMLGLEQGFKTFNGGLLEQSLRRATRGLGRSIGFGIVTTMLTQSSSLVSVLTISFLSAGLISLAAGIGIVFGANLGTTTGAWLIAGLGLKIKISAYAMPMLVFGVILLFRKSRTAQGIGYILTGLGFLFLGIAYMKEGFESFKATLDLSAYAVSGMRGLLLYTAIGTLATVIMQSSHATLVLTITALSSGQIGYENALALAIGSNLGTTISAVIGAFSANVEGRRLAAAHVIFNLLTGTIAIAAIQPMMLAVEQISAALHIRSDDYSLKLAVFHSLFNLLGVVIMTPWTRQLERWLQRMMPAPTIRFAQPKYLSSATMQLPETALEALSKESARLYDHASGIIAHGIGLHRKALLGSDNLQQLIHGNHRLHSDNIEERYAESIKNIYAAIVEFSGLIPVDGNPQLAEQIHALRNASRDLVEAVKALKHMQKNLLTVMNSRHAQLRDQYDSLRLEIAISLRAVDSLRREPPETSSALALDTTRVRLELANLLSDETLDQLIRQHRLDAGSAASLMKDADYTRVLCGKLLDAAAVIFAWRSAEARAAESQVALDDDEIQLTALEQRREMP